MPRAHARTARARTRNAAHPLSPSPPTSLLVVCIVMADGQGNCYGRWSSASCVNGKKHNHGTRCDTQWRAHRRSQRCHEVPMSTLRRSAMISNMPQRPPRVGDARRERRHVPRLCIPTHRSPSSSIGIIIPRTQPPTGGSWPCSWLLVARSTDTAIVVHPLLSCFMQEDSLMLL